MGEENIDKKIIKIASYLFILIILTFPVQGTTYLQQTTSNQEDTGNQASSLESTTPDTAQILSFEFFFVEPLINEISIGGITYQQITIPDTQLVGDTGEPLLPAAGKWVLIPYAKQVKAIDVSLGEKKVVAQNLLIEPVGAPVPASEVDQVPPLCPNETIYSSLQPYPLQQVEQVGTYCFRGYEFLVLNICPFEYIPAQGLLSYYPSLEIQVTLEDGAPSPLFRGVPEDRTEVMRKSFVNPTALGTYPVSGSSRVDDYDLLIITDSSALTHFIPLIERHAMRGISTNMTSIQFIGSSNPDVIREYIKAEYLTHHISYVLIGGDDNVVPAKRLYFGYYDGNDVHGVSDLYYSCLDGTFNYDGDNKWGEPTDGEGGGDVDLVAEVFVGRACVGNLTEVDWFVNKTIAQIDAVEAGTQGHLNEVLMAGETLDSNQDGGDFLDELIGGSSSNGYTTVGTPTTISNPATDYNITTLYDRDQPYGFWSKDALIGRVNTTGVSIINHAGHGSRYVTLGLGNLEAYQLFTNNKPFFAYSWSCLSGGFEGGDSDCIAEYLTVKTPYGAYAVLMNANMGWYSGGTDGDSQRYHRQFWDAVYGEQIHVISEANQDSKEDNLWNINNGLMRWCYYELNLLGDPTLVFFENQQPQTPGHPLGPTDVLCGVETWFSMSIPGDPEGKNLTAQFDWGDNTFSDWVGRGVLGAEVLCSHTWSEIGPMNIRVRVQDGYNNVSSWSEPLPINITNEPPGTPTLSGPTTGVATRPLLYNATSTDPEGNDIWYKFSWGDGATTAWLGPYASGTLCAASHAWLPIDDTNFSVQVKARDFYPLESNWSEALSVLITNEPPSTPVLTGPTAGVVGESFIFTASATEPDNHAVRYQFNWGDGTTSGWLGPFLPGMPCEVSHCWVQLQDSNFEIHVKAKDAVGLESSWSEPLYLRVRASGMWLPQAKLLASGGVGGDFFGWSTAIKNGQILIGEKDSGVSAAHMYRWDGAQWVERPKFQTTQGHTMDYFGRSVAFDGAVALIGAYNDNTVAQNAGAAYIFTPDGGITTEESTPQVKIDYNHTTVEPYSDGLHSNPKVIRWRERQKLFASDGSYNDGFGRSVDVYGEYLIVGSPHDDVSASDSGSAYIFHRQGNGTWAQHQKLTAPDGAYADQFGITVSINGDRILIGAKNDDSPSNAGSAYMFRRLPSDVWVYQQKLRASDAQQDAYFGSSVDLQGDVAVIGAPDADGNQGAAYIFHFNGTNWTQQAKLSAPDGTAYDCFSFSVALDGEYVVAGAYEDGDFGGYTGSAYIFRHVGEDWVFLQKLRPPDQSHGLFGCSVSIDGDTIVVGVYQDDDLGTYSGSVYVYLRHPDVTTSINSSMTQVPRGSNFIYDVTLTNNENTVQTVKLWTAVQMLPNGILYEPAQGPTNVTLNPHENKIYGMSHYVFPGTPLGMYRYYVRVGKDCPQPLWDEDFWDFEVIP